MKIGLQTWGSDGDIRPFLALTGGLRARGHTVSLIVTSVDNKDYSSYGKELDFGISHVGNLNHDDAALGLFRDKIIPAKNPLEQLDLILRYFYNPVIPEMYEAAEKLCGENDVVIGHSIHAVVQAAAEKAGKPHITVMMNHAGVYSRHSRIYGVPNLGRWMNPFWWKLFHLTIDRSIGPEVNSLRSRIGLPPADTIAETVWISKRLNLIAETSAIGQRQPDWPEHHHVCGVFTVPGAAEPWDMPGDLKRFVAAGPPPVFITLGSMFSLDTAPVASAELLVRGALFAGCRAIIQAPWEKLPDIPDHPQIYKLREAPHRHIFPSCAAVVHHGGAGTTHSATLHGCPSIIIEHIADQAFFGNELHRLGAAPKVLHRRSITPRKLAKAITQVLGDPGMKKRAETLREVMLSENGVDRAAELIEKRFSR